MPGRTAMWRPVGLAAMFIALVVAAACGDDDADNDVPSAERVHLRYHFDEGDQGWEAGFSDYGPEFEMDLASGIEPLPASLERAGTGFLLGGMNRTDDLFMFLRRQIGVAEGLRPGQAYRVEYRLLFASNAPTGCFGVGGPPGEAVYLKAGAVAGEPRVELVDGYWELTVDKSNQSSGGEDVWLVGDIANGIECEEALAAGEPYALVEHEYQHDVPVAADAGGNLWLIVGTDSGFEGRTDLYYLEIEVVLEPVDG
jgi:hypothetical protein